MFTEMFFLSHGARGPYFKWAAEWATGELLQQLAYVCVGNEWGIPAK